MDLQGYLKNKGFDVHKNYGQIPLAIVSNFSLEDLQLVFKEFELQKVFDDSKYPFNFCPNFSFSIPDYTIRRTWFKSSNCLSEILLQELFIFYDKYFFCGLLSAQAKFHNLEYTFRIGKGTKTAGCCSLLDGKIIITLHHETFENITPENIKTLTVNGLVPLDKLNAIMIVFEHELLHAGFRTSSQAQAQEENHGPLFKKMALNLFGHTEITHQLLLPNDKKFTLSDFKKDDRIIVNIKGTLSPATVVKINKTRMRIILDDRTQYDVNPICVTQII